MSRVALFSHGTRAQWTASGLVLLEGQIGFVLEDNGSLSLVFGDGVHTFDLLLSFNSAASGGGGGGTSSGVTGLLVDLLTTNKANLVAAINEVRGRALAGAIIADGAPSSTTTYSGTQIETKLATKATVNDTTASATTTYSGSHIDSAIAASIASLVASSPALLNTLKELADAIGDDPAFAATMSTALGNRLRVDIATQGLTAAQQANGRTNLDVYSKAETASAISAAGGGGASSGTAAATGVTYIDPTKVAYYAPGAADSVIIAARNTNTNLARAAYFANPGNLIQFPIDRPCAIGLELNSQTGSPTFADGFTHTNDKPLKIGGYFFAPKGTQTSKSDTNTAHVLTKPAIKVIRRALYTAQPTSITTVTLGGQFNHQVTGMAFAAGTLANFAEADDIHLSAIDGYDWSERAGNAKTYNDLNVPGDNMGSMITPIPTVCVHKGILLRVGGILVTVSGYSLTALNTAEGRSSGAANGNSLLTYLERRVLIGDTSNVAFIVQGDCQNGQLITDRVAGDFTAGENIRDYTGGVKGAVVGTFSSAQLICNGILDTLYTTQVWVRKINGGLIDLSRARFCAEPGTTPGDKIATYNRPAQVELWNCTDIDASAVIDSGLAAGIEYRSCTRVSGRSRVENLPNIATTMKDSTGAVDNLDEDIYGYGHRFIGACSEVHLTIDSLEVRHTETSNGVNVTFNQNAYTGAIDPATCTNFASYGPGLRDAVFTLYAVDNYGQAGDLHEGAQNITWWGGSIDYPSALAKGITGPDGIVMRGHNCLVDGVRIRGARTAIVDSGGAIPSLAGLEYVNRVNNVIADLCQYAGYAQGGDSFNKAASRSNITRSTFRADTNSTILGTGVTLNATVTDTDGLTIEGFPIPLSHNPSGSDTGGRATHRNLVWDYTDTTSNDSVRGDGTFASIEIVSASPKIHPGTSVRPSAGLFRNMSGNSAWHFGLITPSYLGSDRSIPQLYSTVGGAPTYDSLPVLGASLATPAAGGHSTAVAPTVTRGADAQIGVGGTVALSANATDLAGEIVITVGTGTLVAPNNTTVPLLTFTFGTPFATDAIVNFTYLISGGTSLVSKNPGYLTRSNTGFTLGALAAPTVSTTYRVAYEVTGV